MGAIDERTPLRKAEGGGPPYMFMTSPNRLYKKQIHQFQCLICLTFMLLFLTAIAITLLQSVENDVIDNNLDNSSSVEPLLTLSWPIPDKEGDKWGVDVSKDAIDNALSIAQLSLASKDKLEEHMVGLPPNTPSYKHQKSIKTSLRATYLARTGYMMDVATRDVLRSTGVKVNKKSIGRTETLKSSLLAEDVCGSEKEKPFCLSSPYRSVDGTCNNLNNPSTWGVAMQPFRRALPPDYADGVSAPRKATDGSDLPSAREVSVTIHRPEYRSDEEFSVMLAVWGQFLDHDISATALSQGKDGSTISCCGKSPSEMHPECFPVSVSSDDPYFKNISCLEFVRSAPAPTCSLGPREQLNQASSYIDGSVIYGNTDELMSSLRSYENGQLRMTVTPDGRTLLPVSLDPTDGCNTEEENAKGRYCFASGDPRANENVHLTTLHLIMARQHNSVASQLSAINPDWNDETLFQQSRKIVAAQMQHITYNEFLPILLGDKIMTKLELTSDKGGYNDKYNPAVNPTVSNNFATAAFRFAHTLLPGLMKVMKNMSDSEQVELHKLLFDPYKLYAPGYLDSTIVGAMNTPLERLDNYFNKELTEKLFKQPSKPCGLDLVSLNIQRGRDHGLPGYPAWREQCGLSRPAVFDDLKGYVDADSLTLMSSLYKSVDDIDLYTGALSEFPTKDGMLGPTLTCLIGDQFKRLKAGDRFWYETSEEPQAFSSAQLDEIRKSSLAGIICNTADAVESVRSKVMQSLSPDNEQVPCRQIPQPDLTAWSGTYSAKEGAPELKKLPLFPLSAVIGLHVTKASIISDDGSNWSGEPPVNIPMSVFNGPSLGPTHVLPPTVQWTSSAVTVSPNKLSITGSYSATSYAFSKPGFLNFTAKTLSGKYSLDADILWNNTDISLILFDDASFSTSLFFSARSPKNVTFKIADEPIPPASQVVQSSFPFGVSSKGPRSSVIVAGNYSLDKTLFYWSGNLTITLPFNVLAKQLTQNVNLGQPGSIDGVISKVSTMRALFNVTGGTIVEDFNDGSEKLFWNGKIPISIPLIDPNGTPAPTKWTAIFTVTETVPSIKGTFSVPTFVHGFGFNVTWASGRFNFLTNTLFNTSLNGIIEPGYKYYCKIFLSPVIPKATDYDPISWNDLGDTSNSQNKIEEFISDGVNAIDSALPITIVLQGLYSPDKTMFNWLGQGIISVKNASKLTESVKKQKKLLDSPVVDGLVWSKTRFGGTVTGGHVSVKSGGFFNFFENTVWSGTLPVAIPVKYLSGNFSSFLFSLGVHWSGYLIGNSIEGKFSLPQFTGDWFPYPSVQWVNGSFSVDVLPMWNTSLQELFIPGANYYSKILLQGIETPPTTASTQYLSKDNLISSTLQATGSELPAPVVLQGTYSPDKSYFYWSGNFIISFGTGYSGEGSISLPVNNDKQNTLRFVLGNSASSLGLSSINSGSYFKEIDPVLQNINLGIPPSSDGGVSKPVATSALFKIAGGSITEDLSDGAESILWDGQLPVSIPLFGPEGTKSPTKWSAVLTVTETVPNIKGTFSMPNFIHGFGFNVTWTSGRFSFLTTTLFNTSLNGIIQPGFKYYCKVFLSPVSSKATGYDPINWNDMGESSSSKNPIEEFISDGLEAVDSVLPITIVLKGLYSPDKTVFNWLGQGIINVKNVSKLSENAKTQMKFLSSPISDATVWSKMRFGGTVTGGHVSVKSGGFFNFFENTVWSGTLPVAIPVKYLSGSFSSFLFSLGVHWSGDLIGNTVVGKFSLPQFTGDWFPYPSVQWVNGSFSFDILPIWNTTLQELLLPGRNYFSKILLQGTKSPVEASTQYLTKDNIVSSTLQAVGAELWAPIILQGTYSPDKAYFYWSGSFIISLRSGFSEVGSVLVPVNSNVYPKQNNLQFVLGNSGSLSEQLSIGLNAAGKFAVTKSKTLGAIVSSGNINVNVNNETIVSVWSGSLPVDIPVIIIQSFNFNNYCLPWSGSLSGSVFKGSFSYPNISNNGSELEVSWLNGDFKFNVLPLWFTSLDGAIIPGRKYCSSVRFQGSSKPSNNTEPSSMPINLGASFPAAIILKGNYSTDESLFHWNGELLISFKNSSDISPKFLAPLKIDDVTSKPTRPPKPTKPPKVPKLKISFSVTSGNVVAGLDGINATEIWNGVLPLEMTLDNILQENQFTPTAQVSWSGTPSKTNLQGTFSLPVNVVNGTVTEKKNWIGNFSFQFVPKWTGDMEAVVDSRITYNCRVLFEEFTKKSLLLSSSGGLQATNDVSNPCNVLVVGTFYKKPFYCSVLPFMCRDGTIFTWNGEVIITFIPSAPITTPTTVLQSADLTSVRNGTVKRILGKVLSGSMSGGLTGESSTQLWSGSIPATIPFPVFWAPTTDVLSKDNDKVYGHGVIWSGSVFGTTVHGKFSLPQYVQNGAVSSIRWWSGDFSVQILSLWDNGLGDLITSGFKFNSRVEFRDLRNATNILQSVPPTQDEVNSAYRAPLILLGTYSEDRKMFYWSGQFIVAFYDVPDVNIFNY